MPRIDLMGDDGPYRQPQMPQPQAPVIGAPRGGVTTPAPTYTVGGEDTGISTVGGDTRGPQMPQPPRARAGPVASAPGPTGDTDLRTGIANAYQKHLGRGIKDYEYAFWLGNPNYEAEIANSPEAKAHAAGQTYARTYNPAAGWDASKLNDPNKSNTKYNFGRAAQEYGMFGRGNLGGLVDYYNQKYGGHAHVAGEDAIDFGENYGPVDILNGNGDTLQWLVQGLPAGAPPPATGTTPGAPPPTSPGTTPSAPAATPTATPGASRIAAPTYQQGSMSNGDFTVPQAQTILATALKQYYGRDPNPGEIDSLLAGQGYKPGDHGIGARGLNAVLAALYQNAAQTPGSLVAGEASGAPAAPGPGPDASAAAATTQPAASSGGIFSDPATAKWESQLNALAAQLNQPITNPDYQPYVDYLRKYFQQLQGPAYSDADMNLIQTQALDPLTRQRDAARQQSTERLAARGITPSSGIAEQSLRDIDRNYSQLATQQRGSFATQAIDRNREQQARAAQVGNALNQLETARTSADEQRALQSLSLLFEVPQYADRRLELARGSLEPLNPSSLLSNYSQFGQLGLQQSQQDQYFWALIGQAIQDAFNHQHG